MNKTKTPQDMFEEKQRNIKKQISQTQKNIAFFNATNNAIQMALADKSVSGGEKKNYTELIREWREFFINEWTEWYLETNELDIEDTEEIKAF